MSPTLYPPSEGFYEFRVKQNSLGQGHNSYWYVNPKGFHVHAPVPEEYLQSDKSDLEFRYELAKEQYWSRYHRSVDRIFGLIGCFLLPFIVGGWTGVFEVAFPFYIQVGISILVTVFSWLAGYAICNAVSALVDFIFGPFVDWIKGY